MFQLLIQVLVELTVNALCHWDTWAFLDDMSKAVDITGGEQTTIIDLAQTIPSISPALETAIWKVPFVPIMVAWHQSL